MNGNLKPALAEFVGTFILVFIGAGAGALGSGGILGVALAHGLALMVIVYALGSLSGAHVNPAVTFGAALAGKIGWVALGWYWLAQVLGGVVAAFLLRFVLGAQAGGLGATVLGADTTPVQGVIVEAVLTGFLVLAVIMSGLRGKNGNMVGVAIGLVLAMDILMGASPTAIASANFADLWVYLVGPLLGAAIAVGLARLMPENAGA